MSSRKSKYFEYIICFISGFAILSLELISFRILTPYFGTSGYTSGIIINTILLALAIGYLLGGFIADKLKSDRLSYFVILGSGLYLIIIFLFYPVLLKMLVFGSIIIGCIIAILILFFIPMVLLAMIPPYLIKLLHTEDGIGKLSGKIFALSTLGSIIGGSLTTFVFIPSFGSRISFLFVVFMLMIASIIGLVRYNKLYTFLIILIVPLSFWPSQNTREHVYKVESEYNIITVTDEDGYLYLKLGDNAGYHSKSLNPETNLTYSMYDNFLFPQLLIDAEQTLILGNAAGMTMTQIHSFFNTNIDGVEIDSELTDIGIRYFGLRLDKRISIFHEDARTFLYKNKKKYDIIYIDIYTGSALIPFHVATIDFFKLVNESLSEKGIVTINRPGFSPNTNFNEYYLNTITRVFPNSYIFGNTFFAFKENIDKKIMQQLIQAKELPPQLLKLSKTILSGLERINRPASEKIFSDDFAPVEKLTYKIMERALTQKNISTTN